MLANYTYQKDKGFTQTNVIDGSPLTFPGLSRNSYNASLYYENQRFSARASYNWRDQWLITASGRGSLPEFNREYGQLDASLGFNITEDVTLFLEGINLTNEELVQENAPLRPIQFETFGRRCTSESAASSEPCPRRADERSRWPRDHRLFSFQLPNFRRPS